MPVDFSLLSSAKSQIQGMSQAIDKQTHEYKRSIEHFGQRRKYDVGAGLGCGDERAICPAKVVLVKGPATDRK